MQDNPNTTEPRKKSSGCLIAFSVILLIVLVITAIVFVIDQSENQSPPLGISSSSSSSNPKKITTRAANNGDITIQSAGDIQLNPKFYFIPKRDIKDLEFTIYLTDKDDNTLSTQYKNIGDVVEGRQYTVTASTDDMSLFDMLKLRGMTIGVTGGTVSKFD